MTERPEFTEKNLTSTGLTIVHETICGSGIDLGCSTL